MLRWMSAAALLVTLGCSGTPNEPGPPTASLESFVGEWQSVTPSYEFIRLTLVSPSSEQGALAARLTLSGVAWEGRGYVQGDSVVAQMSPPGTAMVTTTVVIHARDARTLDLYARSGNATAFTITLNREK